MTESVTVNLLLQCAGVGLRFFLRTDSEIAGRKIRWRQSEMGECRDSLNRMIHMNSIVGTKLSVNKVH